METRVLVVGEPAEADPAIEEAAELLRRGLPVAFPTETVYGLGADCTRADAVARIYEAKNRPHDNPVIVHVAEVAQLDAFCLDLDERVALLAEAFWPGPLTLVLKARPPLHQTVGRGLDTVGIRVPNHPVAVALIAKSGLGIAAPSANISGKPSPTKAKHVFNDLNGRIPLILDGGPCSVGIESTVLDVSGPRPAILRPGWVTGRQLDKVLGVRVQRHGEVGQEKRSPGTRYRHYSPDAPLLLLGPDLSDDDFRMLQSCFLASQGAKLGYIGRRDDAVDSRTLYMRYAADELNRFTKDLYLNLRAMDEEGVTHIIADGFEEEGHGRSLMDRLRRASTSVLLRRNDVIAICNCM
ncbi:L-threonylcarbamoyladenylate synthase [Sulfidibacter corallicola]